jgi:PKHD-type hydroxylase
MTWLFKLDEVNPWAYADKFLTPEECQKIIDIGNNKNKIEAKIGNKNDANISYRKNHIAWLDENDIDWLYPKMTDAINYLNNNYFNFDLYGFTENLQFTEYNELNDFYDKHTDSMFKGKIRKLSIVIQLSDPETYEGSNLEIYLASDPVVIQKTQGSLIAFPSYILHKVTPLTKGKRYSLVAWISGPNFK